MAGRVVWITGLSGAGKTSLALEVTTRLRAAGQSVVMFDGDDLRLIFDLTPNDKQSYRREDRLTLAARYSRLCRLISEQDTTVVIATISLFGEIHRWNRENLPGYFEVFLNVPLSELRRRDNKGLYSRVAAGEISNVAGVDVAADFPTNADWEVEYARAETPSALAEELIRRLDYECTDRGLGRS